MTETLMPRKRRLLQAFFAIAFAALACSLGSNPEVIPTSVPPTDAPVPPTATTAPVAEPTVETPVNNGGQNTGGGLTGPQRQHLASATVLIYMTDVEDGQYYPFGIGSGTILSADGIILTNSHVAKPSAGGFGQDPDILIIALNENEDSPPVPTYIAEVLAVDGTLDLAVIKITSNMDGSFVNGGSLNLPYVDIGNSDDMHLGDPVNIFGFPGIGGDTITFTKGSVSGFSTEEPVGDRAWIKTDATIAGGNSGGLGANDLGQIIGVPTRGGAGGDNSIADCRVVQDTNGDGRLDQNDTCIPIGGFINALRPINLAMPLIRAAQTGTAYVSPYDSQSTGGGVAGTGSETFLFEAWSTYFDDNSGCAISPAASFASGVDQLTATWSWSGMTDGQDFALYWLIDGDVAVDDFFSWEYGASGSCFPFYIHNNGDALPDGQYTLLLFAGDGLPQIAEVSTTIGSGGSSAPPAGDTVTIDGYVTDGDTGNPISGAVVVVLMPGTDVDTWLDSGTDAEIYTWAETDSNGYFILPVGLLRGVEYPALAGAASLGYLTNTGYLLLDASDPAWITLELELTK